MLLIENEKFLRYQSLLIYNNLKFVHNKMLTPNQQMDAQYDSTYRFI